VTIEEALEKLESITQELESETTGLDASIILFEEGLTLASTIKSQLEEARLKVEQVIETSQGVFSLESLDLT